VSGRVFLCAGHELGGGAAANGLCESPYNARVVVLAVAELRRRGIEAHMAPLTTRPYPDEILDKAAWISERAEPHDLAVDVHLDINDPGCAAFAIERPADLHTADVLAERLSEATGLACRGGMPERMTAAGRLGFLHLVGCRAALVELCSMNTADALFAHAPEAPRAFARGLADGCEAVLACAGVASAAVLGARA
jgi:hypothetical protein